MKTEHTSWLTFIVVMLFAWTEMLAQTVNITVTANTATCMDTLSPKGKVILCGSSSKGTTPAITWDTTTGIKLFFLGIVTIVKTLGIKLSIARLVKMKHQD